jgi:small conductance mechanosensitive channel
MALFQDLFGDVLSREWLNAGGSHALRIVAILLSAWVARWIGRRALPRVVRAISRHMQVRASDDADVQARAETLSGIVLSIVLVAVWTVEILMVLRELGFDIAPVLAGAGVVGLAVGFGAQNLVRDVISGAFMLLEDQVRVGDVAVVNGAGGVVERMNLRTITLRGLDGTVHVFSNGAITTLANKTREFSFYVFDVGIAYKEDVDRVIEVLNALGAELQAVPSFGDDILEPIEVLGVDAFLDSAVVVKARVKTRAGRQWVVGREMNRRIKIRFDEARIEIPFPQRTLHLRDASTP